MRTALFSTSAPAVRHATKHYGDSMHPRFYENEFEATSIAELEFVRSPFYELAKLRQTEEGPDAEKLLTTLAQKMSMLTPTLDVLRSPTPNADNVAFTRYAD